MDDSNKTLIKRIRYLQLTVDIIIDMIEVGEDSMSYILHNLHVLYDEIDNLAKKVVADGME